MPVSPLQSAFAQNPVKRKKPREMGPLESRVSIGPNNAYGAQLNQPIGNDVSAPLPAVGQYAKYANLNRIANSGGSESYFAQNALAGKGPPPIAALPNGAQYTGEVIDSLKSKLHPEGQKNVARVEVDSTRSGSAADVPRIAINRLRSGSSLNADEQMFIDGMKKADPQGLRDALAGSVSQRKAAAQDVLRQRGLERGDARAAARNYNMMVRPRNVMLGTGQTVSMPGMPANVAALRTMGGGGATPLNLALTGMLPANAAVGFDETARRGEAAAGENASREKMGQVAIAKTLLESEDPAEREQGKAIARGLGMDIPQASQPGAGGYEAPLALGENPTVPLSRDQMLQVQQLEGDDAKLEEWAKAQGMKPHEVEWVKKQYGQQPSGKLWNWMMKLPYTDLSINDGRRPVAPPEVKPAPAPVGPQAKTPLRNKLFSLPYSALGR